jgi:hypothetical protein
MSLKLNHDLNTYLAVTISPSSPHYNAPRQLAELAHPSIVHVGQVGAMEDVQLFSVPNLEWDRVSKDVIDSLSKLEGVGRVDVQKLETRAKRDEL